RSLSTQASQLQDIGDATVATNEYSSSLRGATEKVNELADTYAHASESLTGLKDGQEVGNSAGEHLTKMNDNLSALNNMYEIQLTEMNKTQAMYTDMTELMTNLKESVADTKAYKENISELAKNLEDLNRVYSNMLNAMNPGNQG
ncbi:MAG: gliding motility protein GldL, partial [Flavobacteriales bacterium]|nr:gliding motility protein GldL [Flavobacteriales bacterium]